MSEIEDLFKAAASSLYGVATLHNDVGFRIPEYQREYNWDEENIERLFHDCLNGFARLSGGKGTNAFTFLGTLILLEEKRRESGFGGAFVAVVDGQQRLTTLTLVACALYESLNKGYEEVEALPLSNDEKNWIKAEINVRFAELSKCAFGTQDAGAYKSFPYPRIIRVANKDRIGRSDSDSEYFSPLGIFLFQFSQYVIGQDESRSRGESKSFFPPFDESVEAQKLKEKYDLIRDLVEGINKADEYEKTGCEQVSLSEVGGGYRSLFDKINMDRYFDEQRKKDKAISNLQKRTEAHGLARTLLFSAYFRRGIVLTRVIAEDEDSAFDIFDALNTTGEPLTTLETLKPRVIQFEEKCLNGFISRDEFERIKEHVYDTPGKADRHKVTRELVTNFAVYMTGEELREQLPAQRKFLHREYDNATRATNKPDFAQRFVELLADMAEFRWFYYMDKSAPPDVGDYHPPKYAGDVQFLVTFIRAVGSTLVLPILARYWDPDMKNGDKSNADFLAALRAVTAFWVIRRAASRDTADIDSDLRAVMAPENGDKNFGLCAGVTQRNEKLSIDELKGAFTKLLRDSQLGIEYDQKKRWVKQVTDNPLYSKAKAVARFMILVAADQAKPAKAKENQGCWDKSGVRPDENNRFLNCAKWGLYKTLEHVAPNNKRPVGEWDPKIYDGEWRHSLGNLVLLPQKENASISNSEWEKKRIFYRAVTAEKRTEIDECVAEAEKSGKEFSDHMKKLLRKGQRLGLLQPLRDVENWDLALIKKRSRNIAELTWDHLWKWLK